MIYKENYETVDIFLKLLAKQDIKFTMDEDRYHFYPLQLAL